MKFFNDETIDVKSLEEVLHKSCYSVAGVGRGCKKALEYSFTCKERVDTLQLVFPEAMDTKMLFEVHKKGVEIEVYINDENLKNKFLPYSTIYFIKEEKK